MRLKYRLYGFVSCSIIVAQLGALVVSIQYETSLDGRDLTDCALVLPPNPSQYSTNLLESDFGGLINCITYDAINRAYFNTKNRIDVPLIDDEPQMEAVAAVGQYLLDISQQLAVEFNLNVEDIEFGLPQIDTLKTAIRDICPAYLSSISCQVGRYRRYDGLCNNANNPTWGATMTPFSRLLPPQFADRLSQPRFSVSGKPLPSARVVSKTIHPDEGYHDHAGTTMAIAWGQFMDHDFTLMATPLDARNRNEPEECCYRPDHMKNPFCMEIDVPEDDQFYAQYNVRCQDFVRAFTAPRPKCRLGSRNPFNTLTGVIDGNTVYGATENLARQLRTGSGGLLRMNPIFESVGLKELLPMKTDIPDEGCVRTNTSQFCFLAGEIRVNEQLILTCIHTLMAREHNRIAKELTAVNAHWNDETLFQEARRITIAQIQHITFNEFLPLILGKDIMEKYDLSLTTEGYWNGYNAETNPNILDAFSAAAFRFGHSLLPSTIERWSKLHKFIASKRLSDVIRRPYDLYKAGVIDEYFVGLLNQVAQAMDDSVTQEVTNSLFKKVGNRFGLDLVSFNVQRGRDFGLPSYMYFRKHCGLHTVDNFEQMVDMMPNSTVYRYMSIYEHPWDIDLWSGGAAENPLPGSMLGPTFACIIAEQMSRTRRGDRFWYESPNQPSSFTPEQLHEIRKVKLSRILCDNTDLLDTVQIYAMVLPDHEMNPRVACKSSVIPRMDLSQWAELPPAMPNDDSRINHTDIVAVQNNDKPIDAALGRPSANTNSTHRIRSRAAHDYPFHPAPRRKSYPGRGMTQAIIKNNDSGFESRSFGAEEPDIEGFFRKNVPIYDGIPKAARTSNFNGFASTDGGHFHAGRNAFAPQRHPAPQTGHYFHSPSAFYGNEDEEEQDKTPASVEEVDPEHDSQYETVPMMVDENGKQRVMSSAEMADDGEYGSPYSTFPAQHQPYQSSIFNKAKSPSFGSGDDEDSFRPSSPYRAFPSFDSGVRRPVPAPASFGTFHQYNSLADQRPRHYKHFPHSAGNGDDRPTPYSPFEASTRATPYSPFEASTRATPFSPFDASTRPTPYSSFRAPPRPTRPPPPPRYEAQRNHRPPFAAQRPAWLASSSNTPHRMRHREPLTLEEYHRIHNTFGSSAPYHGFDDDDGDNFNWQAGPQRRPIIVPQTDGDEDEKDEKDDEDDKAGSFENASKSFISLNFNGGNNLPKDDDDFAFAGHRKPATIPGSAEGNNFLNRAVFGKLPSHSSSSLTIGRGGDSNLDESLVPKHSAFNTPRFRPISMDRGSRLHQADDDDVEYPPLPIESSETMHDETKFEANSEAVKTYVDSIFVKNKALEQQTLNKNRAAEASHEFASPYNPNFGERLNKQTDNILWHTAGSTPVERIFPNKFDNILAKNMMLQNKSSRRVLAVRRNSTENEAVGAASVDPPTSTITVTQKQQSAEVEELVTEATTSANDENAVKNESGKESASGP